MPANNPKQPEVTEEDRELFKRLAELSSDLAGRVDRGLAFTAEVEDIARHRIAAERATERRVLEEAARVAEHRHQHWRMPHPDDAKPGEVCCDVTACADIAAAIRAMKEEPK